MSKNIIRKNIPLLFMLAISMWWAFYYQSSNAINGFGSEKKEWLLLIDGLIFLPLICFIFIKNKKEAATKALAYSCLIVLLGSFIIPQSSKIIWPYLESGRYLILFVFIILEITTIFTVFFAVKAALNMNIDPDEAISHPIESRIGKGAISALLSFEARMWTYALFARRIKSQSFIGEYHFTYHNKDGVQSNQLGFILLILFELPIAHLVLHFLWSPFAANLITGFTLFSLAFFIAEYRAMAIRPISLTSKHLIIRYGIWNPVTIPLVEIKHAQINTKFIARASNISRYNMAGNPNVEIQLHCGKLIYLGIDSPNTLISTLIKLSKTD